MLSHKRNLNKFKNIDIVRSIFFNHSAMKLEINCKKKTEISKHVETKTHASKQPMGQYRSPIESKI